MNNEQNFNAEQLAAGAAIDRLFRTGTTASGEQHEAAAEAAITAYYDHIQGSDSRNIETQAVQILASLMTLAQANRHDFDLAYIATAAAKLASGIEYAY